jgi:hypothetical protein
MDHLAIMKKSWGLTTKRDPWDNIKKGEKVYFKDSGEPVTIKATVSRVLQFAGLTPKKVKELLGEYGKDDGIKEDNISYFYNRFKSKKYCILVLLERPLAIEPFSINKKGFGSMAAWISIDNIKQIKI